MSDKILKALGQLDPANDNHWTADGLPRVDTVRFLSGDQSIDRSDITAAAPGVTRSTPANAVQAAQAPEGTQTPTDPVQTAPAPASQAAELVPSTSEGKDGEMDAQDEAGDGRVNEGAGTEVHELEAELRVAQERLAEIESYKVQILDAHAKATAEVDRLTIAFERVQPPETTGDAIRGYLNSQMVEREARAQQNRRIADLGFDLKSLLPAPAPIDAAMRRKTGFGHNRPKVK